MGVGVCDEERGGHGLVAENGIEGGFVVVRE